MLETDQVSHRKADVRFRNRNATPGREFVIVESSWKNIIPKVKVNRKKAQDRTGGTPDGKRYPPSPDSAHAPCRLAGRVVPAGSARRFTLVFDVPPGQPLQMEYRGFTVKSELVKVR